LCGQDTVTWGQTDVTLCISLPANVGQKRENTPENRAIGA